MAASGYTRKLGHQPGVQLTPVADAVDALLGQDIADQVVAIVARTRRGRIDRPVVVDRSNVGVALGKAESNLVRSVYEARMQVSETLDSGAEAVVVSRLVPAAATKRYAVVFLVSRIEQTFVSPLYPVAGFDAFEQSLSVTGGAMVGLDDTIDSFSQSLTVIGGSFPITSYTSAVQIVDGYSQSIQVVGGSFPGQLIANSSAVDGYSQSISVVSGSFPSQLITNSSAVDGYSQSISITGGALT